MARDPLLLTHSHVPTYVLTHVRTTYTVYLRTYSLTHTHFVTSQAFATMLRELLLPVFGTTMVLAIKNDETNIEKVADARRAARRPNPNPN